MSDKHASEQLNRNLRELARVVAKSPPAQEIAPVRHRGATNTYPHVTCPRCGHEFQVSSDAIADGPTSVVGKQRECPECNLVLECTSVYTIYEWVWEIA